MFHAESPFLIEMPWDHETTPNPSLEGNRHDADECLLPSWEGPGVGRFMVASSDGNEIVVIEKHEHQVFPRALVR